MKHQVISALVLSIALAGCNKSNSGNGGGGSASTASGTTQQLTVVPIGGSTGTTTTGSTTTGSTTTGSTTTGSTTTGSTTGTTTGSTTTTPPAPTITAITPNQAVPGQAVAITGANFANLTDVQLGGISLVNATYSPTEIDGTVPQGGPTNAPCDVVVFSTNGNATLSAAFLYLVPPANPSPTPSPSTAPSITYTNTISGIFSNDGCFSCHSGNHVQHGVHLDSYSGVSAEISPGNAAGSTLVQTLTNGAMSQGFGMNPTDLQTITDWINAGAPQ